MPENGCSLVVVGASAGGVEALQRFVRALPAEFPVPILVVLHASPTGRSYLPEILGRAGPLPTSQAQDGETMEPGRIYIAPPDHHLLVADGRLVLGHGPRENGHRPAIDPLFRSAAASYDSTVAGVILSGTLDDGTVGLSCIKQAHGATLVQEPDDALYRDMPTHAIDYVRPEYVASVEGLAEVLVRLTAPRPADADADPPVPDADELMDAAPAPSAEIAQPGELVAFSCPDCGGTLWETEAGGTTTYRCRVGHAYTMNTLVERHAEMVERALWTAYRALEERAAVVRRISRRLSGHGRTETAERFDRQAEIAERQARELKTVLDTVAAPAEAEPQTAG